MTIQLEHEGQPGWWPQHNADGYFVGETNDCGGPQPNNTAGQDDWPEQREGYVPRRNRKGESKPYEWLPGWDYEEDHKGETGYLNGQPHTINQYGPYPDGWSNEPPEPTAEEKADQIRAKRDSLMAATDYLLMSDYPITPDARVELEQYRQALRDVTGQKGFPDEVIWPDKPAWLA